MSSLQAGLRPDGFERVEVSNQYSRYCYFVIDIERNRVRWCDGREQAESMTL
jgi:hypothetical protein